LTASPVVDSEARLIGREVPGSYERIVPGNRGAARVELRELLSRERAAVDGRAVDLPVESVRDPPPVARRGDAQAAVRGEGGCRPLSLGPGQAVEAPGRDRAMLDCRPARPGVVGRCDEEPVMPIERGASAKNGDARRRAEPEDRRAGVDEQAVSRAL